jgi:hypothetical protein
VRMNQKSKLEFRHRKTSLHLHQNNLIHAKFHTAGTPERTLMRH